MDDLDRRLIQVVPSERQLRLQRMEFYAFVHFTINTFTDREWGDGTEDPAVFAPGRLDAQQWADSVRAAGMTGLILTCKHHDGFCLWPSRYTKHTVAASPYKNGAGDIVGEVAAACRRAGLKFGVYLSPWDRNQPLYGSGKTYDDYFVGQLTELLTGYGDIFAVWFDGACGEGPNGKKQYYDWERYYETVRILQPGACIHVCGPDIRWCGNEAGETRPSEWSVVPRRTADTEKIASASQQADDGLFRQRPIRATDRDLGSRALLAKEPELIWYPAEVDTSIRPGWFWHAAEDAQVRPLEKLIDIYEKAVGGNATLLLNIPPTTEGLFHKNDVERLRQLGEYICSSYSSDLLAQASLSAPPAAEGCTVENIRTDDESFYLPAEENGTAELTAVWPQEQCIRRVVLQEQLRLSQRVESFVIDVLKDGAWQSVAEGTVIGHKRIVVLDGVRTTALRIRITDSRVAPALQRVGVYACARQTKAGEKKKEEAGLVNGMTQKELLQLDAMADRLRQRIRTAPDRLTIGGTVYYVAADGCDDNDGSSPAAAWRTLEKVSAAPLMPGDGVLFRRGDVFRGSVYTKPGVTYGAYGTGEKPRLYGWQEDLAVPALWECVDAVHHIWRYIRKIPDVGVLVFNDGERHSGKLIPSYIGGRFVCREDESRPFVMAAEMRNDLDIYWHFEERFTAVPSKGECFPVPDVNGTRGELYLRCDAGNPGEAFASIEAAPRACMFYVGGNENVRIDNLCLKYIGIHAVSGGGPCVKNLCVTGCEIGWVGGTIQHYFGTDPNYPQGGRGTVTRYGNGVEIYGGCDGYTVADCYIYQMYDAGITHQVTTSGQTYKMKDVCYRGNLVEHCVYSIEYFLDVNDGGTENMMENVEICGNVLRYAGCGWGQQRHNKDTPAHIKGWSYRNPARGYRIHHNVFDRAAYRMLHLVCHKPESLPVMDSNTYIQYADGLLGQYGANETAEPPVRPFDAAAEEIIASVFGDKNAGVYRIG